MLSLTLLDKDAIDQPMLRQHAASFKRFGVCRCQVKSGTQHLVPSLTEQTVSHAAQFVILSHAMPCHALPCRIYSCVSMEAKQ